MIKWFVSVYTVVPVMVLGLVCTKLSLVSVYVENDWIDRF